MAASIVTTAQNKPTTVYVTPNGASYVAANGMICAAQIPIAITALSPSSPQTVAVSLCDSSTNQIEGKQQKTSETQMIPHTGTAYPQTSTASATLIPIFTNGTGYFDEKGNALTQQDVVFFSWFFTLPPYYRMVAIIAYEMQAFIDIANSNHAKEMTFAQRGMYSQARKLKNTPLIRLLWDFQNDFEIYACIKQGNTTALNTIYSEFVQWFNEKLVEYKCYTGQEKYELVPIPSTDHRLIHSVKMNGCPLTCITLSFAPLPNETLEQIIKGMPCAHPHEKMATDLKMSVVQFAQKNDLLNKEGEYSHLLDHLIYRDNNWTMTLFSHLIGFLNASSFPTRSKRNDSAVIRDLKANVAFFEREKIGTVQKIQILTENVASLTHRLSLKTTEAEMNKTNSTNSFEMCRLEAVAQKESEKALAVQKENDELRKKYTDLETRFKQLETKLVAKDEEYRKALRQKVAKVNDLAAAQESLAKQKEKAEAIHQKAVLSEQKAVKAEKEVSRLTAVMSQMKGINEELTEKLATEKDAVAELKRGLETHAKSAKVVPLNEKTDDSLKNVKKLTSRIKKLEAQLASKVTDQTESNEVQKLKTSISGIFYEAKKIIGEVDAVVRGHHNNAIDIIKALLYDALVNSHGNKMTMAEKKVRNARCLTAGASKLCMVISQNPLCFSDLVGVDVYPAVCDEKRKPTDYGRKMTDKYEKIRTLIENSFLEFISNMWEDAATECNKLIDAVDLDNYKLKGPDIEKEFPRLHKFIPDTINVSEKCDGKEKAKAAIAAKKAKRTSTK